ncbi:MAG TPA: hypothetical protein VGD21_07915 [Lysobacter sp.]
MHASTPFLADFRSTAASLSRVAWLSVLCGGLTIAAADLVYCVIWWSPQGVPPSRILQSIASGVLGPASHQGGATTALFGLVLQCFIATMFVVAYTLVASRLDALLRHPLRYGVAYGMLLLLLMNQVVVPLSAAPQSLHPNVAWMLGNIPANAVFGVICALTARRALHFHG